MAAIDPSDFQTSLDLAQANLARDQSQLLAMERGARPEEIEQLKAVLAQAQATYKQAKAEFDRAARLLPQNAISGLDYDIAVARRDRTTAEIKKAEEDLRIGMNARREEDRQAKQAEIQALKAAVTDAKNKLSYATLTAPFTGEVAAKSVENFQTVQTMQPIARLLDTSKIKVTVRVPESAISLVPQVKQVTCRFDALPNREFEGMVTEIGIEASSTTRTYPVTVQLDQPSDVKILPGMAAVLRAKLDKSWTLDTAKLAVPVEAVFTPQTEKQSCVWVVDEATGKVSRRKIDTGPLTPGGVSVVEGIKPGEWIVTAGVHSLRDGQTVRILQEGGR